MPRVGVVVEGSAGGPPWLVLDVTGQELTPVSEYLRDVLLADASPLTCRSYAYGLLRWFRLLWLLEVAWDDATEAEAALLVAWLRGAANHQRLRGASAEPAGTVNPRTGKAALRAGYAPSTINHALSVVSGFYNFHGHHGRGPKVNPVRVTCRPAPLSRCGPRWSGVNVPSKNSLYLDLHTWAAGEPDRWAAWVAPSPGPPPAIKGYGSRRRRVLERTADRGRERQPLLPALVEHVQRRYEMAADLLAKGRNADSDDPFTVHGRTYRRLFGYRGRRSRRRVSTVHVVDEATRQIIHVTQLEEAAFWDWAVVETLRHTGIRVEELCELTQLSIRQYQRPNGEVVACSSSPP